MSKSPKKVSLINEDTKQIKASAQKVGSARGIESLFRNSYRAQLDMIALAATKANIIISLNGLLVSLLMLSGAYFLRSDPLFLIPVSLLLLTCTTAIVFAVLAARPEKQQKNRTIEDFRNDKALLLSFDQFSSLSSEDYIDAMREMMQNNGRVYTNMIAHLHALGCIADRKFNRLYISYNAFIVGLVVSVLSVIVVFGFRAYTDMLIN